MSTETLAMPGSRRRLRGQDCAVLALLCLVCAGVNLTKAVHIDDAAYLAIVDAILRDPLHVMASFFNWHNTAEPLAEINQPHLFFYLQAIVTIVFGRSLVAQHLLMAGVTTIAVVLFHRLATLVAPARPLLLTALFALGPALLPGQNLMVDVPLVALWLLFFWAILSSKPSGAARYGVAALAVAAACLVKYTSLVLLVVFAATIVRRRQWRALAWLVVPIAALGGWSALNLVDYGRVHLLDRRRNPFRLAAVGRRSLDWIACVGAVAPFTIAWWPWLSGRRVGRAIVVAGVTGALIVFVVLRSRYESGAVAAWWAVFFGNGVLTVGLAALGGIAGAKGEAGRPDDRRVILWWWLAGVTLFIVVLTPFVAVRHVLLVMPAVLLLFGSGDLLAFGRRRASVALALMALLGVGLAVSDYIYADVYRVAVPEIQAGIPVGARVWCVGHWGWQWYATRAGMQVYDVERTNLQRGDYVVIPSIPDRQVMRPEHRASLREVREFAVPAGPLSWLRTMSFKPYGGYYYSSLEDGTGPPWLVSTAPLETFVIYRVGE